MADFECELVVTLKGTVSSNHPAFDSSIAKKVFEGRLEEDFKFLQQVDVLRSYKITSTVSN